MAYINQNDAQFLSARITKKGRKAIANGSFNIKYFQIGDSEYNYKINNDNPDITQRILSPVDVNSSVKYPFYLNEDNEQTYGDVISQPEVVTIRNQMGTAGFVSHNDDGDLVRYTYYENFIDVDLSGDTFTVSDGTKFNVGDTVTLILDSEATETNETTAIGFIYKITAVDGDVLTFNRDLPNISGVTTASLILNHENIEYPDPEIQYTELTNNLEQHNPWKLEVVWSQQPIGLNPINKPIRNFETSVFNSTKQFLPYFYGETNDPAFVTSYLNSFGDEIKVSPEEQRCIAILHFDDIGSINNNPEQFYKYDDYISDNNVIGEAIIENDDDEEITDLSYFKIYLDFVLYHRNTEKKSGLYLNMGTEKIKFISTNGSGYEDYFHYLIDDFGTRVGKIFIFSKIIVIDDQEIVAALDMTSNRNFTLPAPRISLAPTDLGDSLFDNQNQNTYWVTYLIQNDFYNCYPCNYIQKISNFINDECNINIPSNISFKFAEDSFKFIDEPLNGINIKNFKILIQESDDYPDPTQWRVIDYTTIMGGVGITQEDIENKTFVITAEQLEVAPIFNLQTQLTNVDFGISQYFPGYVRMVRASDVEVMNMYVNLPSNQFNKTQNPTYTSGDVYITEVSLCDDVGQNMITAKSPKPIKRIGSQVFSIKLDF